MTAWSDAITAATTVGGTRAAARAADNNGDAHNGVTPAAAVVTYLAAVQTAGQALYAADPTSTGRVEAGLANAALNGWVGRPSTAGTWDILGFSLAGQDYVTWEFENGRRQFLRGGGPE